MTKKITIIAIAITASIFTPALAAEWRDTCVTNHYTSGVFELRNSANWVSGSQFCAYHETCLENQPTVFSPLFSLHTDSFYRFDLSFNTHTTDGEYWRNFYMIIFLVKQLPSGSFPYSGVMLPNEILNYPNRRVILGAGGDTILQVIKTFNGNVPDGNSSISVDLFPEIFNRSGDNYSIALSIFPYTNDQESFDTSHAGDLVVTNFQISNAGAVNYSDGIMESIISPQKTSLTEGNAVSFLLHNQSLSTWDTITAYYKTPSMPFPVMEKIIANIPPFAKQILTFSNTLNLSATDNWTRDTITVWLEADQRGDNNFSNDTITYIFDIYPAFSYTVPCVLNFKNSANNVYWNTYSKVSDNTSQQWNIIDNEFAFVNTNFAENNSILVSPSIKFKQKQSYKITVRYKAHYIGLPTVEKMTVGISTQPSFGIATFPHQINLLNIPLISDTSYTEVSFFYGSDKDTFCYIYVENFSQKFSGGLFIKEFIIEETPSFTENSFIDFDPVNPEISPKENLGSTIIVHDVNRGQASWSWQINSVSGGGSYDSKYYFISETDASAIRQTFASIAPIWLEEDVSYILQYDRSAKNAGIVGSITVNAGRIPLSGYNSAEQTVVSGGFIFIDSIKNSGYKIQQISLQVPVSGFYYIEFENMNKSYAVMIDNIAVINKATLSTAPHIKFAKVPTAARLGGTNVHFSVTLKNPTESNMLGSTTKVCYKVNNRTTVRENCDLSAYEISTLDFSTGVNFSTLGTDTAIVKFWTYRTSPTVPAQDTIYKTIIQYSGHDIPFVRNFLQDGINEDDIFTTRPSGVPNWKIVHDSNGAYTGGYYAVCNPSYDETMQDYIVFQPLNFVKDSVYLISFYAAVSTPSESVKIVRLLSSKTGPAYNDFLYNKEILAIDTVRSSEYVQFKCYYKATETKMHFLALYDNSSPSDAGLKIDRFVVVDSAAEYLRNVSLNNIHSNDTSLVCDMILPQDVSVSVTNNSLFACDTFSFLIKTDLYDTSVVVVKRIKEDETSTVVLPGVWRLSTAGIHHIEAIVFNDTVRKSRTVAAPYDLILSSVNVDNSNSYILKRGVSASIKSGTDSSLQNVIVAVEMNDSVVLEKTIDLVTSLEQHFIFDDSLYLPDKGDYRVVVFIATSVPCNMNPLDDTFSTTLIKQDSLAVDVDNVFGSRSNSFVVYPNPATDVIYVLRTGEDVHTIDVLDMYGKVVGSADNGSSEVSVRHLPAGMYFLKITGTRGSSVVKIIKK